MNAQQNIALHELILKVRLTISKPSREYDSTLIFKHLLEVLNALRNINRIHKQAKLPIRYLYRRGMIKSPLFSVNPGMQQSTYHNLLLSMLLYVRHGR